jgi:hypothetical protein
MTEEPEQPLTPSYDDRAVPIVEHPPEPEATAEPARVVPSTTGQRKPKPKPKRRKPQQRRQPEWNSKEFRYDHQILDLQTRVLSLRTFLEGHDLWPVFVAANPWW